jgi:predicted permease
MTWLRIFKRRWWDEERSREIDSYLEIETACNTARGMTPEESVAAARRKFGNQTLIREDIYLMNTAGWVENTWQDLRYAARQFRLSPAFALVAVCSLALGIGANTAIFELLDAVRLRSLPIHRPSELAEVHIVGGNHGMGVNDEYGSLTRPVWQQLRTQQKSFSGMFAWSVKDVRTGEGQELQRARGLMVSGDFFRVLGTQPWRGRLLMAGDETACPSSLAVVSYPYWQTRMGGREVGSGTTLIVDGQIRQVIGVTPPEFYGLAVGESFDIAEPFCQPGEPLRTDVFDITVMGRLRPGVTPAGASPELDALSAGIFAATIPVGYSTGTIENYKRFRMAAYPASNGVSTLREGYDKSLWLLLGITGLVLLIACANLANLMLARASARQREVAVRLALGASRWRIMRQMLAESVLLAGVGAAIGVALAQVLSRILVWSLGTRTSVVHLDVTTDWRVLLFTASAAAFTCILFGVIPSLRATHAEPVSAMKSGGRGMTAGRERFSLQRCMVAAQVAVSLVLLVAAMLFVRSFRNLMTLDPGLRESGITVAFAGFNKSNIPKAEWGEFRDRLLAELRSGQGIANAATTTMPPLMGSAWGHNVRAGSVEAFSMFTGVSAGYVDTMGIPLIAGRNLRDTDTATSPRVALVNQAWVRSFLSSGDPLGKTLLTTKEPGYPATVYQIVGVMRDSRYSDIRETTPPMTFVPASQYPISGPWTAFMIHSNSPSASVMNFVRRRIAASHPEIVVDVEDFQLSIRDRLVRERLMAMLSGFFGVLAVLLAGIGVYGVISYMVSRRRNEIGIRMALGARRVQVLRMVIREAALLLGIGIAAGTVFSLVAGRSARSLLFGLEAYDPLTLLAAAVLLAGVALGAALLPARRAARLDPMTALRYE